MHEVAQGSKEKRSPAILPGHLKHSGFFSTKMKLDASIYQLPCSGVFHARSQVAALCLVRGIVQHRTRTPNTRSGFGLALELGAAEDRFMTQAMGISGLDIGQGHTSIGVLFGGFGRRIDGFPWFPWWFNHLPGKPIYLP